MNKLLLFAAVTLLYTQRRRIASASGLTPSEPLRYYLLDGVYYKQHNLPSNLIELRSSTGRYSVVEKTVYENYLVALKKFKAEKATGKTTENWLQWLADYAPKLLTDIANTNKNNPVDVNQTVTEGGAAEDNAFLPVVPPPKTVIPR